MTKAMMRLRMDEAKAGRLVDVPGRHQDAVGPEYDLSVPRLSPEADAFLRQAAADAQPARVGLHIHQTQLRHRFRFPDQEHRADDTPLPLRDPTPLPFGVEVPDEFRRDLR